jgi:hypothetical protein
VPPRRHRAFLARYVADPLSVRELAALLALVGTTDPLDV